MVPQITAHNIPRSQVWHHRLVYHIITKLPWLPHLLNLVWSVNGESSTPPGLVSINNVNSSLTATFRHQLFNQLISHWQCTKCLVKFCCHLREIRHVGLPGTTRGQTMSSVPGKNNNSGSICSHLPASNLRVVCRHAKRLVPRSTSVVSTMGLSFGHMSATTSPSARPQVPGQVVGWVP